ncbi:MAG: hypothetical protein ACR2PS_12935 [Pseudomonadales bacterium]
MEINRSIEILETLANGVDPATGEVFPSASPYNNPDIIRSLFACVQHIKYPPKKVKKSLADRQADNLSNGLPKNAGLPWSDDLKSELANDFKSGESPSDLANKYERTKGAIVSELKKQGLITDEEAQNI